MRGLRPGVQSPRERVLERMEDVVAAGGGIAAEEQPDGGRGGLLALERSHHRVGQTLDGEGDGIHGQSAVSSRQSAVGSPKFIVSKEFAAAGGSML